MQQHVTVLVCRLENRTLSCDSLMLGMRILFCSCLRKVHSQVSDALSQALCNLSLAFLADFTLSDSTAPIHFIVKLFSLTNYTLLFVWIERQDYSVHMSSVLQVQQLYTGIPLLEAYLLPMANNRTCRERPNKRPLATWSRFIRMRVFHGVKNGQLVT